MEAARDAYLAKAAVAGDGEVRERGDGGGDDAWDVGRRGGAVGERRGVRRRACDQGWSTRGQQPVGGMGPRRHEFEA